jgi:predicted Zn-dependent peptidase
MRIAKALFLFLLTTTFIKVSAQTYQWKTATSNGYTYKYVTNDPMKARFYTLKNGLSVILSENHKEPRIAVNIAVRAGSNTDPKSHTGLAHYLEHMLFKGTDKFGTRNWAKEKPYLDSIINLYEKYTKTTDVEKRKKIYHEIDRLSSAASKYSIANEYDKLMADLGSQGSNAHTSVEETVYEEDIPSNSMDKFLLIQAERFRNPIMRIFHTELEAVYEEKNRSLDNDGSKMWEKLNFYLFPTHNYGQQTTIGTIEHLKNPSIKAIQAYYDKYYVPNNMSIIMAGDFNADELIKKIDQSFSYMKPKPFELYNPAPEKPITTIIEKEVFGPSAENMRIGFRIPAANTHDAMVLNMISELLYNRKAGLLDINLNKTQKVQMSQAGIDQNKDYGVFILSATPKDGQTLEDLKPLLLNELEKVKSGDFDASLLKAIVANSKLRDLQGIDYNSNRVNQLMSSFIISRGDKWDLNISETAQMATVTKEEIKRVAKQYFDNNYVLLYKRKGEDKNIVKVDKPLITPVETNAGQSSPFVKKVTAMQEQPIKPVWLDYNKDILKSKAGIADVLYVQNKENELFNLNYRFDLGSWNDPLLSYAVEYLQFLGTDKRSADEISKKFYDIACSYRINVGTENVTVTISGLQENFNKAVGLFENILGNCRPNEEALNSLKGRWIKARTTNKLNKNLIAAGLRSYAQFGDKNPFNSVLSNEELNQIKSSDLISRLHQLLNYSHAIIYYGPQSINDFTKNISILHHLPDQFLVNPPKENFSFLKQDENLVLFADYDMVQSEIYWMRNIKPYDPSQEAVVSVFNNYFGGGMGSVVFQTIRESKALAYSTYAYYYSPSKKEDPFTVTAYVGSQADKMNDAIAAMNELLNQSSVSDQGFNLAIASFKKDLETERIVKDGIIFSYLNALKKGNTTDVRQQWYETSDHLTKKDLENLHQNDLTNKPYTYCIIGSDKRIKTTDLEKIGMVKKLNLNQIFGY